MGELETRGSRGGPCFSVRGDWIYSVGVMATVVSAALGGTLALPSIALAQDAATQQDGPTSAVLTREKDPLADTTAKLDPERVEGSFQPKGMEAGQFLLFPKVEVEQAYNSNIYAAETDTKGDFITRTSPELAVRSRFIAHALNFSARVDDLRYWDYSDDNHTDLALRADGRYDVSRDFEVNAFGSAKWDTEDRGSPDAVNGIEPTDTFTGQVGLGSQMKSGRTTLRGRFTAATFEFDNVQTSTGTITNNSDRDRLQLDAEVQGLYEVYPGYAAEVEVSGNTRTYDQTLDDLGYARSSEGYKVMAGVAVDLTDVIRGDLLAGYLSQDYDDPRLADPSGPSVKASFNWTPSRLTLVVPSLERSVQETTTLLASSSVRTRGALLVRHELQRNVVLTGIGSVSWDDYEGISRTDTMYEGIARGTWVLAPNYYVGGEVGYRQRTSSLPSAAEYDQTVVAVRFGLQM